MAKSAVGGHDPVVITGVAVEAPGGIDSLTGLWLVMAEGRELLGPFPRDRGWPLERLDSSAQPQGGLIPDRGGFLDGASTFDPGFFGISATEARVAMDPQQWVALRVAWRALENAGVNPAALMGDGLGCYLGVSYNEHAGRAGMTLAGAAGRISHSLGTQGPSISIDTACSSALTALHLAASAVRAGDCDWALAGAVCVMGKLSAFSESAKVRALSVDGHCRSFADDATGTVWSEGAGMVVLERESRARQLGHHVYARLLASRVNHNGSGQRVILPNAQAQERLMRETLDSAGIAPGQVGLIEGHGAGTRAGDGVEIQALQRVYGSDVSTGRGPLLGSVKSNLGHTQAAAGMLGLIKLLLCGKHGEIAPSLFAGNPVSKVNWDLSSLRLAAVRQPWPTVDGVRYGAVSAFGLAGTNAHAILAMPG